MGKTTEPFGNDTTDVYVLKQSFMQGGECYLFRGPGVTISEPYESLVGGSRSLGDDLIYHYASQLKSGELGVRNLPAARYCGGDITEPLEPEEFRALSRSLYDLCNE